MSKLQLFLLFLGMARKKKLTVKVVLLTVGGLMLMEVLQAIFEEATVNYVRERRMSRRQ